MITKLIKKIVDYFLFFGKKVLAILLVIILLSTTLITIYHHLKTNYIGWMTLTLNYAEGRNGLNPEGGRFDIAEIKSDEVLEDVIKRVGDNKLTVKELKDKIAIDTVMPKSSVDNTVAAIASNSMYTYTPTEFNIYYSQKNKFTTNKTGKVLNALSEAYSDYFNKTYARKNNVLDFDIEGNLSNYDYRERYELIYDKLASIMRYLDKRSQEEATFRSSKTGYTYANLISLLNNIKNVDLEKLNSYITQNAITYDRSIFLSKHEYLRDKNNLQYALMMNSSNVAKEAMSIYNPHIISVAFIPSVDLQNEYYMGKTKTGLDLLVKDSYDDGAKAVNIKKEIDLHEYLIDRFTKVDGTSDEVKKNADAMIEEICIFIKTVSEQAKITDDECLKLKNKNYIKFYYHPKSFVLTVKYFIKIFIILFVLCVFLFIIYRRKRERYLKLYHRLIDWVSNTLELKEGTINEN